MSSYPKSDPWRAIDLDEARRNRHLLIGGQYQLLAPVASEAPFDRFLARQVASAGLAKRVSVKRILASDHRYTVGRDMLFDEAQALLAIEHPGVPTLIDFVEDSEGAHLVHEFIEGAHLDLALQHLARQGTLFAFEVAAYVASEIAWTLHASHTAHDATGRPLEIVHRTLHPRHVLITRRGQIKVTGHAHAQMRHRAQPMTNHGRLRGAPAYFAPEYIAGDKCVAQTDVYGLGVMLFELVTGRECFPGATLVEALQRVVKEGPDYGELASAGVPADLVYVIQRATQFSPQRRFHDAAEMALALDGWLTRVGGAVRPWILARFFTKNGVFEAEAFAEQAAQQAAPLFEEHPTPEAAHPGPYTETLREAGPAVAIDDLVDDEPTQGIPRPILDRREESSTPIFLVSDADLEAL
ncbi:MAG: serine/threonine-protein kinase [Deltaproteobacteria bacterium]